MLNQTEQTVLQTDDLDSAARTKLDSLMSDTQKLERTVQELLDQVEFMKNSDLRGEDRICCHYIRQPVADSEFLSFQGRQTASQSTSCSRRPLQLVQTPPPSTLAALCKHPATYGDSQKTR